MSHAEPAYRQAGMSKRNHGKRDFSSPPKKAADPPNIMAGGQANADYAFKTSSK